MARDNNNHPAAVWPVTPATLLLTLLLGHLTIWTLVPALVNQNLPLDVIEGLVWGNEWQWGYDKHPPMSAWMMEGVAWLTGRADWGQYLLAQLSITVAFFAIWSLARELLDEQRAIVAVLLLEGVYFHNFQSPEFNANVALLLFWSLTLCFFWRAYKNDRLLDWILCGLAAAMAVLSKYFAAVLILPLVIFLLVDVAGRRYFRSANFYVALLAGSFVLMPHLLWMLANDFITIQYAMSRGGSGADGSLLDHVRHPLKFLAVCLAVSLPVVIMFYTLAPGRRARQDFTSSSTLFLWVVLFTPLLLVLILSAVTGMRLRSMWAYPLFLPLGIFLVSQFTGDISQWRTSRFLRAFVLVNVCFVALYAAIQLYSPLFKEKGKRTHFPGRELALKVQEVWAGETDRPLRVVGGDPWLAGNAAWYSGLPARPSVSIELEQRRSPWVDDEDIRREGAMVLWSLGTVEPPQAGVADEVARYRERFGAFRVGSPIRITSAAGGRILPEYIGWGIVPPAE
ncbi:glycosyltransferase family 39 protein [Sedimenticola hydrogenitrophicus]|uniref:glycosyltransferase family 39 protein n=1 Tax=Sedimenticola hydrogenitrophicus TaxID=2967975 RepID=UPI0021A3DD66|nr:glycosyltransferase family 39 protein [Sedimenticola hydrogenitrophicus]